MGHGTNEIRGRPWRVRDWPDAWLLHGRSDAFGTALRPGNTLGPTFATAIAKRDTFFRFPAFANGWSVWDAAGDSPSVANGQALADTGCGQLQ